MSGDSITVRRCTEADWRALRAIRLEALSDTPEAYGSTYLDAVTWSGDRWRAMVVERPLFICERAERVVGMVSGGTNDERPGTRWMYAMFVATSDRGTNAARRLVDAVSDWARDEGATALYLHVTAALARSRAFYEKVGFVATGDVITMDRDSSITLVTMVRNLTEPEFRVARVHPLELHGLRRRVLRGDNPESSVADPRDENPTTLHYGGFLDDRLVVSASFYPSTSPLNELLVTYQLRYMATDFDVQGHGFGAIVLAVAEDELRVEGAQQLWANGRDTALGFYRATGWSFIEGTEHLSPETALPHTVIYKRLV